jgi:predicted HTH transcriptional regulator
VNKTVEVFEHPDQYWAFLTAASDNDFEGQFFDRKEAGRPEASGFVSKSQLDGVRDEIIGCISAFANSNKLGGLLVIGISKSGEVKGIDHLREDQLNSLCSLNNYLLNQSAKINIYDCQDEAGQPKKIALYYVPFNLHSICETLGNHPKAWLRQGSQNTPMNYIQRDQLRRDKRIIDYEMEFCCPYNPRDLDQGVIQEFRRGFLANVGSSNYTDEELLYQIGALITHDIPSGYAFTKAGFLFFAANPQRLLASSYIRLLRFDAEYGTQHSRGQTTYDKNFTGPISKQIRDLHAFFRDSAFFKIYHKRNAQGSFSEEPEYPFIAIDEAIVNAVAHRDYVIGLPSECESYKNAFVVCNPGRVIQRDKDVPTQFSLDNTVLVSTPRNPKLIEWLKFVGDAQGTAFVRALSEGTKRMSAEMAQLSLPAPSYEVTESQTKLILLNNASVREALHQATVSGLQTSEYANLFPLLIQNRVEFDGNGVNQTDTSDQKELESRFLLAAIKDALIAKGWYIDKFSFSRIVAHRQGSDISIPARVKNIVRFYPAYIFQIRKYWNQYFLCLDYTLEVKNVQHLQMLLKFPELVQEVIGKRAVAYWSSWRPCRILTVTEEWTLVSFEDVNQEAQIPNNKVIPNLAKDAIARILTLEGVSFDFHRAIKQHSLALEPAAAKIRSEKTTFVINDIAQTIFPLILDEQVITLGTTPLILARRSRFENNKFYLETLREPQVEFNQHQASDDVREGITKYGAYNAASKEIEIVPICTTATRQQMVELIERLKTGKYKYRGSERTFSARFTYRTIITVSSSEQILTECQRVISEHPEWLGNSRLDRIFLLHTPEKGYALDDETSPYYRIKRFLLEVGIPCQMIDTPTLQNPDFKDLNLALNLTAKCGVVPWVLPNAIPDADFFVGLSSTLNVRRNSTIPQRLMGYANVFNQFGRWEFYSANSAAFSYDERTLYYYDLVRQTLERLPLSETPSIYFHHSAKFSREDQFAILNAARSVRPKGNYSFIWINTNHNIRLYDSRAETDGSLRRGSYLVTSPNQIYLSTTGYNPYRKVLGTPHVLEINARIERPEGLSRQPPDMRAIAIQILSLTKLNWASTDSVCAEPITIKYAGDIAYLTAAFLRQPGPLFRLNKFLENTPWFI